MNISVVVINFGVLVEGIVLLWIVIMRLMSVILVFGMEFMFIWSDIQKFFCVKRKFFFLFYVVIYVLKFLLMIFLIMVMIDRIVVRVIVLLCLKILRLSIVLVWMKKNGIRRLQFIVWIFFIMCLFLGSFESMRFIMKVFLMVVVNYFLVKVVKRNIILMVIFRMFFFM